MQDESLTHSQRLQKQLRAMGARLAATLRTGWQRTQQQAPIYWRHLTGWLMAKLRAYWTLAQERLPQYWRAARSWMATNSQRLWSTIHRWISAAWTVGGGLWRQYEPVLRERAGLYAVLMRLDKPIGSFLLLWPTLWALWIATGGLPSPHLLVVFIAGVFLTRSAGCVMNDYADRNFDRYVARTRNRPLTSGQVSPREAGYLIAVLLTAAFLLVLTTNQLTVLLSFVALPLGGGYPFMKRYTYIPQLFQGIAFGWGIPMAFAAAGGDVPRIAWLLYIANILWSMSYDTVYAMVDREDDKKIGVKSTAILFDDSDRIFVGLIQAMLLLTLTLIGTQLKFDWHYYLGVAGAAGVILHLQYLIKDRVPERCFLAFRRNNWLGVVVFAGIVLHYYHSVNY